MDFPMIEHLFVFFPSQNCTPVHRTDPILEPIFGVMSIIPLNFPGIVAKNLHIIHIEQWNDKIPI